MDWPHELNVSNNDERGSSIVRLVFISWLGNSTIKILAKTVVSERKHRKKSKLPKTPEQVTNNPGGVIWSKVCSSTLTAELPLPYQLATFFAHFVANF